MNKFFIFLIVVLFTSQANAWNWYRSNYYPYPYRYGYNYYNYQNQPFGYNFLHYPPPYYSNHPLPPRLTAKQTYDNKIEAMESEKRYKDRVRSLAIENKDKEIENAKKWHDLRRKEDYYRSRGYLPPKPTPKFIYKGVDYGNYENFKKTEEYRKLIEMVSPVTKRDNVDQELARLRKMSYHDKQGIVVKNRALLTLESDITSGKYSSYQVKKMLELWKLLQQ